MTRQLLTNPKAIYIIFSLSIVPLLLYPAETFKPTSQEWWLPALLVIMAVVGIVQIFRRTTAPWPWYLVSFAQGFNIISRLLMLMPQSFTLTGFNAPYFILSIISMAISGVYLWLIELPELKQTMTAQ